MQPILTLNKPNSTGIHLDSIFTATKKHFENIPKSYIQCFSGSVAVTQLDTWKMIPSHIKCFSPAGFRLLSPRGAASINFSLLATKSDKVNGLSSLESDHFLKLLELHKKGLLLRLQMASMLCFGHVLPPPRGQLKAANWRFWTSLSWPESGRRAFSIESWLWWFFFFFLTDVQRVFWIKCSRK